MQRVIDPVSPYGRSGSVLLLNPTDRDVRTRYGVSGQAIRDDATVRAAPPSAANIAPVIEAGANQSITLPATAALVGTATDASGLTTLWSKVSGPGTVTFGNAAQLSTTATFGSPGTYVLRLDATDGQWPVFDQLTVTVA